MSSWRAVQNAWNSDWGGNFVNTNYGIGARPTGYGRTRPARYPSKRRFVKKRRYTKYKKAYTRGKIMNGPRRNGAYARNGNANLSALAALPQKAFDAEFQFPFSALDMRTPTTGAVLAGVAHDGLPLVNINIGTGEGQRLGKDIVVHSLFVSGSLNCSPHNPVVANGDAQDECCLYVVIDKQCNGTIADRALVWGKSNTFGGAAGMSATSPESLLRNLDNTDRFVIVKKKRWTMRSPGFTSTAPAWAPFTKNVELFINFGDLKIDYLQTDPVGAIAGFRSNQLLMYWGTSKGITEFEGFTRVRYTSL
nr:MAG: capsid protein [Cressdnaviricota sp.]